MAQMNRVLVLMSTYNGERYIKEQIDSIINQVGVELFLLVRDDGSLDETCKIIESFTDNNNNIVFIKGNNVGVIKSFSMLIEMSKNYQQSVDYYAFADQDDVWLPDKIETACDSLNMMDSSIPLLFSSNSIVVDEKLNKKGMFHKQKPYRTRENVMVYPTTEQGCSMVFNRKALELYNYCPPIVSWHDRRMMLLCNFFGKTVYCHTPLFLYRIHSNNTQVKNNSIVKRLYNDLFFLLSKERYDNYEMVDEFRKAYGAFLNNDDQEIIDIYMNYHHNLKYKWKLICLNKFQQDLSWCNRMRKALLILLNKI